MRIHYFQRYHSKENVDTANAMLLLSRLYSYSTTKFFAFLGRILPENADVELSFNMQEKGHRTIPDATITQPSFKVVIETKLHGDFTIDQLIGHLDSFKSEDYKVLLTLDPLPMKKTVHDSFIHELVKYNSKNNSNIIHQHVSFKELIDGVSDVIDERDFEMLEVLKEYSEYCYASGLIPDDWKRMRVQLASVTIGFNKAFNIYYDDVNRGFSGHEYLGLYSQKAVRAIGKIITIVTAAPVNNDIEVTIEKGIFTDEMKAKIWAAIEDAKKYGYSLDEKTRYFFVDNFYDTFFEKETPYAPMGSRMFDLTDILGIETLPETSEIAELLKDKKW